MIPTKDWQKFNPDDGYEKMFQDVKLKNGKVVYGCWPNAGLWNVCYPQPDGVEFDKHGIPVELTDEVKLHSSELF